MIEGTGGQQLYDSRYRWVSVPTYDIRYRWSSMIAGTGGYLCPSMITRIQVVSVPIYDSRYTGGVSAHL